MLSFTCFVHNIITQRFEVDMHFVIITYMHIVLIRLFHHKVLYLSFSPISANKLYLVCILLLVKEWHK